MKELERQDQRELTAIADELRHEVEQAEQHWQSAVGHAIRAGELLTEAKAQVKHGEWLPWLETNFPGSTRTAQGYMRLARERENAQALAHLGVEGALRQLAAPRNDRPDRDELGSPLSQFVQMADDEAREVERRALADGTNPHLARAAGHIARAEAEQKAVACGLLDLANHSHDELGAAAEHWAHLILASPEPWELADAKDAARERFGMALAEAERECA